MAMVVGLMMMMLPISTLGITCPTSCSTLSPLPYPFGAAPGCGLPGFQMTDCSTSPPQWNLTVAGYISSYYIKNISYNPEYSNPPQTASNLSYGYGGTALVYDFNPSTTVYSVCEILNRSAFDLSDFTTSNLYAFVDADLTYYQDSYLFLNCSAPYGKEAPDSGVLKVSSTSCMKYINHCNLSFTGSCIEYIADKQLQLATLLATYSCSYMRRFVIADETAPISSWISLTQFAWGPVKDADSCTRCQKTGGTCGYNIDDESFVCYCSDRTYQTDCKSGHSKAIAIGASLAATLILILAGIAFYYRHKCYYCAVRANREHLNLDGINQAPLELSYWSLSAATKSFSTQIGKGAFGKVYRGRLYNGSEVAVKVLDSSVSHTDDQFLNEVASIGNIHHMNVARLVGFCFRKSKRILVYEFVSNGSLDKYLFAKKQAPGIPVLNWKQRFDIALGIARGLSYMHEECRNCIIHCDIKPQNILLDDSFCPKIADFGLARLLKREESRVMTQARGTPGYVAPEFWSSGSGPLSAKFDVYSYGVVLLEMIRGSRSFEEFDPFLQELEEPGMNSFHSVSIIDKRIENDADLEQAQMCTRVALWCIQEDPSTRPKMSTVVQYLLGTAAVPQDPPKPFQTVTRSNEHFDEAQRDSSESFFKYSEYGSSSHPLP